jgi:hypothetical protein
MQYVDDWFRWDKHMHERLNCDDQEKQLEALQTAASYYGINRTLRKTTAEKTAAEAGNAEYLKVRLSEALSLLKAINPGVGAKAAIKAVDDLTDRLKRSYTQEATSAASKFLWLKFKGSSIVIYDKYAYNAIKTIKSSSRDYKTYEDYYYAWQETFQLDHHKKAIESACEAIPAAKQFTCAASDDELNSVIHEQWFHERVFDKYLWEAGSKSGFFGASPAADD